MCFKVLKSYEKVTNWSLHQVSVLALDFNLGCVQLTMNVTSGNQSDCPEVQVPMSLFFALGVVSLAENLLVVVAVFQNRNLHSPMYCFICSLAAFNTIASLTKTPENLMIMLADGGQLEKTGPIETSLDDVIDSLLCMSFVGSIFSFLAIAVDR